MPCTGFLYKKTFSNWAQSASTQRLTTILKPHHTLKPHSNWLQALVRRLGAPCISLPVYFYGHRRKPGQRPACTHARAGFHHVSLSWNWGSTRFNNTRNSALTNPLLWSLSQSGKGCGWSQVKVTCRTACMLAVNRLCINVWWHIANCFSWLESCDEKCFATSLIITPRRIKSQTLPLESWHPGRDMQRCHSPIATCKCQSSIIQWPLPQVTVLGEVIAVSPGDGLMPDAFWSEWFRHFP